MSDARPLPRILCVDDEPNVLEGLVRTLFDEFDIATATSGAEGLELIRNEGPFAVIVSDMRMPAMDGATFLSHARAVAPDSTRVLLTGHADQASAIAAVNDGHIFQFLTKPCQHDLLSKALHAAVSEHRLVAERRELLDKTLKGSIQVMVDILSITAPSAFARAQSVRRYVVHLAAASKHKDRWQYELAAMLFPIGCITLPSDTLDKLFAGQAISEQEQKMFDAHPQVGARLLAKIPRFETVAQIVKYQGTSPLPASLPGSVQTGCRMLQLAIALNDRIVAGRSMHAALAELQAFPGTDPELLAHMRTYREQRTDDIVKAVRVLDLRPSMILDEDVCTPSGNVIVSKGHEVTPALIERLLSFKVGIGVREPVRVRIGVDHEALAHDRSAA